MPREPHKKADIKKKLLEDIGKKQPSQMSKTSLEMLLRKLEEGGSLTEANKLFILKIAKAIAKTNRKRANEILKKAGLPPLRIRQDFRKQPKKPKNPE